MKIIGSKFGDIINSQNAGAIDINAGDGENYLLGSSMEDTVVDGKGRDIIISYDGDDTITAKSGVNFIKLCNGNDMITIQDSSYIIDGGNGKDTLIVEMPKQISKLENFAEKDLYMHLNNTEQISVMKRIENIVVNNKAYITGTNGDNEITVGSGTNVIDAGDGNDVVYLANGTDTVNCGKGDDIIITQLGNKKLVGGSGIDNLVFSISQDVAASGNLVIDVSEGNGYAKFYVPKLRYTMYISGFENIIGGAGNDLIRDAMLSDNILSGSIGNDTLISTGGTDTLEGGSDHDWYRIGALNSRYKVTSLPPFVAVINNYDVDQARDIIEFAIDPCENLRTDRVGDDVVIRSIPRNIINITNQIWSCMDSNSTIMQSCYNFLQLENDTAYWQCVGVQELNDSSKMLATQCTAKLNETLSNLKKSSIHKIDNGSDITSMVIIQSWFKSRNFQHATILCKPRGETDYKVYKYIQEMTINAMAADNHLLPQVNRSITQCVQDKNLTISNTILSVKACIGEFLNNETKLQWDKEYEAFFNKTDTSQLWDMFNLTDWQSALNNSDNGVK